MNYKIEIIVRKDSMSRGQVSATEAVRGVLRGCRRPEDFNLCYVSRELCLSTRTLSRRLNKERTNFQLILDQERKQLCMVLISSGITDALDLATNLGFSDSSHFYRKFKLWFQVGFREYVKSGEPQMIFVESE